MSEDIVIVGMARTPMGGLLGELSGIERAGAWRRRGESGGEGSRRQRRRPDHHGQRALRRPGPGAGATSRAESGARKSTEAVTLNKMCGSGLQAVAMARQALLAGEADVVVAGGMESMSRAPFLMPTHRGGKKYGHDKMFDHMAIDGLEDAYEGLAMGVYADQAAKDYQFTRQQQDAYALETLTRAQSATNEGRFKREIAPIESKSRRRSTPTNCRAKPSRKKFRR